MNNFGNGIRGVMGKIHFLSGSAKVLVFNLPNDNTSSEVTKSTMALSTCKVQWPMVSYRQRRCR
jgi:hypothetical protein